MQNVVAKGVSLGVYIITTKSGDKINGMTASWVSQVSLMPIMLMVAIAPERYTHGLIKESGYFAINTLSEDQMDTAKHFGFKSGRTVDKFKDTSYFNAKNGSPVLDRSLAFYECKLVDTFNAGDHTLFAGEVLEAKLLKDDKTPLLFYWDDYF